MLKFYADHTEFKVGIAGNLEEVFVLGGILISPEEEAKLASIIREIKTRYVDPDMPIKYNLKDLKKKYQEFNLVKEYEKMLQESKDWRIELVKKSLDIDYTIIIAVIENPKNSWKKKSIVKSTSLGYAFTDALMRLGLEAEEKKLKNVQVVSDWPESSDPKPFNNSYYYGYWRGKTPDKVDYYCGTLKSLGFHDTVLFASMNHSNMLQFADIIIGSARDFFSTHFDEREYSLGMEITEILLPKYRGFPRHINRGISISSGNTDLKKRINKMMKKYIT